MLFFLMVFAMTRMTAMDKEQAAAGLERTMTSRSARAEAEQDRLRRRREEEAAIAGIQEAVQGGAFSGRANVAVDDRTVKITLNPEAFFGTGSSLLNPGTKAALAVLAEPLRAFPNDVIIEGHTDSVPVRGGAYRSNWELSVARAVSVIEFFADRGVSPERMVAGGYGEYHPAYPNDTEANRARNRRIEITIVRQQGGGS